MALGRRTFLKTAAGAAALPCFIPGSVLGKDGATAASERIVVAGVGIGRMGGGDQRTFLNRGDVQYVAMSDVKKNVRDSSVNRINSKYKNKDCKGYNDFREIMVRDDIDAVHCATPDQWHAIVVIEACRSGKDIFCQKPETKTLREGKSRSTLTSDRYRKNATRKANRSPPDLTGICGLDRRHGRRTIPTAAAVVSPSTEHPGGRSRITPAVV